ncbi:MAG: DUF3604 domain-containing protein [Deltaproteobacteria bacterium]|nr:DUF3604 domain-containing protein [Deltaproteobacteria bacterium]
MLRRHGAFLMAALALGCGGDRTAGEVEGARRPQAAIEAAAEAQRDARRTLAPRSESTPATKAILFGDLHVHTTWSFDAFLYSLPVTAGEGAHPAADACDFARYCSALDFYALTDHAENLTSEHWAAEKESIRQCNARAGDPSDPDLVAFTGFEWTQVGLTPETHWGHKNVIFPGTAEAELPVRPIGSVEGEGGLVSGFGPVGSLRFLDPMGWSEYVDFVWLIDTLAGKPRCERGVDTRSLPVDCMESAPTPDELFEKLDQWGFDSLVIPHGTAWGVYTPPGTSIEKHLTPAMHDPERQTLIEVMSGHGNSEEYRNWRSVEIGEDGEKTCPAPTAGHLACCWRAGEIMRDRCGDLEAAECESRVEDAKQRVLEANVSHHLVFPDTRAEDWLDCDQCRDCFKPAFGLRPRETAQYAMALSNPAAPNEDGDPLRFRFGFLASSDNHKARPGTGYKQYERRKMTDATGVRSSFYESLLPGGSDADPRVPQQVEVRPGLLDRDTERVASFFYTGGLVALHSDGRDREAVWQALKRREVYGTSGPRLLLWFDLLNGPDGPAPMGSEFEFSGVPRFEVRALGAFEQQPGCPDESHAGLSPERLEHLCRGECYNPGDRRHPIVTIEIVRIRPQTRTGEDVGPLIEDPWKRIACLPKESGCVARFEDPEYPTLGRDALYYARAIQEETPAVNGAQLRVERDASGRVVGTAPCYGDYRTDAEDDCLAPVSERAWSSPIFLDQSAR